MDLCFIYFAAIFYILQKFVFMVVELRLAGNNVDLEIHVGPMSCLTLFPIGGHNDPRRLQMLAIVLVIILST